MTRTQATNAVRQGAHGIYICAVCGKVGERPENAVVRNSLVFGPVCGRKVLREIERHGVYNF